MAGWTATDKADGHEVYWDGNLRAKKITAAVFPIGMTAGSVLFVGSDGSISQDNQRLFWNDTDNRLGIGTSTPTYILDVRKNTNASEVMANFINPSALTDGRKQTILFGTDNSAGKGVRFDFVYDTTPGDARLDILHYGDTTGITLKDDGNVGIGTDSPDKKLEVVFTDTTNITDPSNAQGIFSENLGTTGTNALANALHLVTNSGSGRAWAGIYAQNDGSDNSDLNFYTETANTRSVKAIIKNDGNVGIGTTAPATKLHVSGALTFTDMTGQAIGTPSGNNIILFASNALLYRRNSSGDTTL